MTSTDTATGEHQPPTTRSTYLTAATKHISTWWSARTPTTRRVTVAAAAAATITQTWYTPETFIGTGDNSPLIDTFRGDGIASLYNTELSGAGSVSYLIGHAYDVTWYTLFTGVGLSDTFTARAYLTAWVAITVAAVAWMLCTYTLNWFGVIGGSLFALFNPYMVTHVPNILILVQLAVTATITAVAMRAGDPRAGPPNPRLWALPGLLAAPLAYNAPQLLIIAAWTVLLLPALIAARWGTGGLRRCGANAIRGGIWILASAAWWTVPLYLTAKAAASSGTIVAQTDIITWSWTHANSSLTAVADLSANHAWGSPVYFPVTVTNNDIGYTVLRLVAPLCVFAAIWLCGKQWRRTTITIAVAVTGIIFLGKGLHPPGEAVNIWLYNHVPGMWILREPFGKLGPAAIIAYTIPLALLGAHVTDRLRGTSETRTHHDEHDKPASERSARARREHALTVTVTVAACAALFISGLPVITGDVVPDERATLPSSHVRIPDSWYQIASAVNNSTVDGKTLVLPLADYYQMPTTWGYYGVDTIPSSMLNRPTANQNPGGYFTDPPGYAGLLKAAEQSLLTGDTATFTTITARLGVSHVIWRHDLDDTMFTWRTYTPAPTLSAITTTPGLTHTMSTPVADLYTVTNVGEGTNAQVQWRSHQLPTGSPPPPTGSGVIAQTGAHISADTSLTPAPTVRAATTVTSTPTRLPGHGTVVYNNLSRAAVYASATATGIRGTIRGHITANTQPVPVPDWTLPTTQTPTHLSNGTSVTALTKRAPVRVTLTAGATATAFTRAGRDTSSAHNTVTWNSATPADTLVVTSTGQVNPPEPCVQRSNNTCAPVTTTAIGGNEWQSVIAVPPATTGTITELDGPNTVTPLATVGSEHVVLKAPKPTVVSSDYTDIAWVTPDALTRGPWSPVGNCNDTGADTIETAGIDAHADADAVTLRATRGSACVYSPVQGPPGDTMHVHIDAHVRTGKNAPRACLYTQPQRQCTPGLAFTATTPGHYTLDATITGSPNVATRELFLYADSALGPADITYTNVSLTNAIETGATVVPENTGDAGSGAGPTYMPTSSPNPGTYTFTLPDTNTERTTVVLTNTFNSGWRLRADDGTDIAAEPVLVDGYAQGWILPAGLGGSTVHVTFAGNTVVAFVWAGCALIAGVGVSTWLLGALIARRRRRRTGN